MYPGQDPHHCFVARCRCQVIEQLNRAEMFLRDGRHIPDDSIRFRYLLAATYFAAAARENLKESIETGQWRGVDNSILREFEQSVAYWSLIGNLRSKDFHEGALVGPIRGGQTQSMIAGSRSPLKLRPKLHKTNAIVQGDPSGKLVPSDDSHVSWGQAIQIRNGMVFHPQSNSWRDLSEVLSEYIHSFRNLLDRMVPPPNDQ